MRERKFRERDAALKFSNWIKSFEQKPARQGFVIYRKDLGLKVDEVKIYNNWL